MYSMFSKILVGRGRSALSWLKISRNCGTTDVISTIKAKIIEHITVIGYLIAFLNFCWLSQTSCKIEASFDNASAILPVLSPSLTIATVTSPSSS